MSKSKKTFWSRLFDSSNNVPDDKVKPQNTSPIAKPQAIQQSKSPIVKKSYYSQLASPTAQQQKPQSIMSKPFSDLKKYLNEKYEFCRIRGKNQIYVRKPKSVLPIVAGYDWLDLEEDKLLCELFEQGFSVDAKVYLSAFLNGLDEYGKYSTYNEIYLDNFKK